MKPESGEQEHLTDESWNRWNLWLMGSVEDTDAS